MLNGEVYEVRGTEPGQEMTPKLIDIAAEKYNDLPGGDQFEKKHDDMKTLTQIYAKHENQEDLTKEDLRLIYEIDGRVEGFGYEKDKRIGELLDARPESQQREDLANLFDCCLEQIALTQEEALSGDIVYFRGGLNLRDLTSAEGLTLPERIGGYLDLGGLTSAEGLTLPERIGGDLDLGGLSGSDKEQLREAYPQHAGKI